MAKVKKEEPALTFNGVTYPLANLSEEAKNQLVNIQAADTETSRLKMLFALAQTARNAYQQALIAALPSQP